MSDSQTVPPVPRPDQGSGPGHPAPGFPVPPPPAGYAAPAPVSGAPGRYAAPAGAYQVPAGGYGAAPAPVRRPAGPRTLGLVALLLAVVTGLAALVIAGFAFWQIGHVTPDLAVGSRIDQIDALERFVPVREHVLWAEISFWLGTVGGVAAIVLGIIAIVKRRGRGLGIAALIIAGVTPLIYGVVALIAMGTGAAGAFI